ncbi:MAG: hypothetical protein OXH57_09745 [Ekhidna sp.]|nr:hypothetical protein [Ekhidna sp.]
MDVLKGIQEFAVFTSLILGVGITLRSVIGYFGGGNDTSVDKIFANIFIVMLYIQSVVEAYLFFFTSFGYEESLRAIEHIALTLLANIMTQGGRLITLKSSDNTVKFRFRSIYYGIATALLIYAYVLSTSPISQ